MHWGASDEQFDELLESLARVIVIIGQENDVSQFMTAATLYGVGGPGYMWIGVDWSGVLYEGNPKLSDAPALRHRVLKGGFSIAPGNAEGTQVYEEYSERQKKMPATGGNGTSCNLESDDDGSTFLWAQDHDGNTSTPLRCSGYDPLNPGLQWTTLSQHL